MVSATGGTGDSIIAQRVARLTPGQRECLRLVAQLKTSKDMARILGISVHAVDMRLRTSLRVLDVAGRAEAALLLQEYDPDPSAYQRSSYQPPQLGTADVPADIGSIADEWSEPDEPPPVTQIADADLADARWLDVASAVHGPTVERPFSATRPWGRDNDLPIARRLAWIGIIAVSAAIAFGSLISAVEALSRIT